MLSVQIHGNTINLCLPINKLLNANTAVVEKDHEFHEVFKIFDGRNNNCSKLFMYKPGNYDQINTNNKLILCLKIMESTLIDMFSTPSITI